jgi:hypothetical protein
MIRDIRQIEREILDRDGSCRDINIEEISFVKARDVTESLNAAYRIMSAVNSEGEDVKRLLNEGNIFDEFEKRPNSIHVTYENERALISHLQLYLFWGHSENVSIEFTFFPEAIAKDFSFSAFEQFISPFITASGSEEYFVRYENASWKYGDTSPESGVIFHGKMANEQG